MNYHRGEVQKILLGGILDPEILHRERFQIKNLKFSILTSPLGGYKHIKGIEKSCNE